MLALTYILLARAFRSLVLPLKAVLLNLVSLAAAFGIVVIVFQLGHGSGIWGIDAMQAINPWMPIMIFAFLFGLSMDYEVFMLTRMREAYDETGSTSKAIELGLARTGKLVTSCRARADVRLPGSLLRAGLRDQGARNRARRRNHLRRDRGSRPARAGHDALARRRQLVDAEVAGTVLRIAEPEATPTIEAPPVPVV